MDWPPQFLGSGFFKLQFGMAMSLTIPIGRCPKFIYLINQKNLRSRFVNYITNTENEDQINNNTNLHSNSI